MQEIKASIIICSYNRTFALKQTLYGLAKQAQIQNHEVIIIDNHPDGNAKNLTNEFGEPIPCLKYFHEPKLGLSNARNLGIEKSQNDLIIFLDDDAIPEPDWLAYLVSSFEIFPDLAVLGGKILPKWSIPPPAWLTTTLFPALSLLDLNMDNGDLKILDFPLEYPVGANIAYRKKLILEYGGFSPKFGRSGYSLLSGEETELNYRLHNAGYKIAYTPKAIVEHIIHKDRISKTYFRRRYYWSGRTNALLDNHIFGKRYLIKGVVRRMFAYPLFIFPRTVFRSMRKEEGPMLWEIWLMDHIGYLVQGLTELFHGPVH